MRAGRDQRFFAAVLVFLAAGAASGQSDQGGQRKKGGQRDASSLNGPSSPLGAHDATSPVRREYIPVPPGQPVIERGFHMEGPAELEIVVGDSKELEQRIDRFYAALAAMDEARHTFYRSVREALDVMGYTGIGEPHRKRGVCPAGLAGPYRAAYQAGERFRQLGKDIDDNQAVIRELQRFGEGAGLTPSYRWKGNRVRNLHRQTVIDYREMRGNMLRQVMPEVNVRRCVHTKLMSQAAGAAASAPGPDQPAAAPDQPSGQESVAAAAASQASQASPHLEALPVVFFIDNRACTRDLELVLSGASAGRVPAGERVAFQAPVGRHQLCLLPGTSGSDGAQARPRCGDRGTVRNVEIHDGWALASHCW